jgi:TPR repeat protein
MGPAGERGFAMAARLVRCIEGHIYDADAHDKCPTCGASAAVTAGALGATEQGAGSDDSNTTPVPTPWQKYRLPAVGACVVLIALSFWAADPFEPKPKPGDPKPHAEKTEQDKKEIAKRDTKSEQKTEAKAEQKAETKTETKTEQKAEIKSDTKTGDDKPPKVLPDDSKRDRVLVPAREPVHDCDRLAGTPDDPDRIAEAEGVRSIRDINSGNAIAACDQATRKAPNERRFHTQLGRAYRAADRNIEAAGAYRSGAEKGSAFSAYALGLMHRDGTGIPQDFLEARRYLRQSAETNLPMGMVAYARHLYDRRASNSPNYGEARRWVVRAAEAGLPDAINLYGFFLENGWGGDKDVDGAIRQYQKAAQLGVASASFYLGQIAEFGRAGKKDTDAALRFYETAARSGDLDGMRKFAELTLQGRPTPDKVSEARNLLIKAADAGHADSMQVLGDSYQKGRLGEVDMQLARQWWEKAAARGNTSSMVSLGVAFHNGNGVPRSYSEARRWYELAAEKGNSSGLANIGVLYEFGLGVPQNFSEAWRLFDKAAANGNTFAMIHLGQMVEHGKGMKQDYSEAQRFFLKAWQNGDRNGQWRAANLADRVGIGRNVDEIAKNMLQAVRGGSDEAREAFFQNYNRSIRRDTREAIERILSEEGFYSGPANGRFGRGFHDGLVAYLRGGN